MALEKETKSVDKISRNKNPKIKSYPKIKVARKEDLGATLQDTNLKLLCPISELMSLNRNDFDVPVAPTILNLDSISPVMVPTQRILIVDDEPYNLLALTTILAQAEKFLLPKLYGPEIIDASDFKITDIVDHASNGRDALNVVQNSSRFGCTYGLIFMDCNMPI